MIVECLEKGKKNRKSFEELKVLTGCHDTRKLRKMISDERKEGAIIISSPEGGYWLPENAEEVKSYVETMSKEARSIFYMLQPARAYLKEYERSEA